MIPATSKNSLFLNLHDRYQWYGTRLPAARLDYSRDNLCFFPLTQRCRSSGRRPWLWLPGLLHRPFANELSFPKIVGWIFPGDGGTRNNRFATVVDLMWEIISGSPEENISLHQMETRRAPSPREKHKVCYTVRLLSQPSTIHGGHRAMVSDALRVICHTHFQPRQVEESKLVVRTDTGNDVLDWGEDDNDLEFGGTPACDARTEVRKRHIVERWGRPRSADAPVRPSSIYWWVVVEMLWWERNMIR